jgi:putative membrane protein
VNEGQRHARRTLDVCQPDTRKPESVKSTEFFRRQHVDQYDKENWYRQLLDMKGSMVREIFSRVLFCFLWSAAVVAFDQFVYKVGVANVAHMIVGTFLSLLLVFRTNSSYDRWWEGRRQWGAIINETRNLARAVSIHLKEDPLIVRRAIGWTMEMPWAIMYSLRKSKWRAPASEGLPLDEVEQVTASQHVPLAIGRKISALLAEGRRKGLISDYVMMSIDNNVQLLVDYFGACERIHKTPLPFAYVVHLRRALIIYVFTLPFALLSTFGWETVPATLLIAYILFGIEEIGVEIEDPFGEDPNDLPLELYCHGIQKVLQDVIDTSTPPLASHPAHDGAAAQAS